MGVGMLESLNVFWHLAAFAAAIWAVAELLSLRAAKREWEQAVLPVLLGAPLSPGAQRSRLLRAARYALTQHRSWGPGVTWQVVWSAAPSGQVTAPNGEVNAREALAQLFWLVDGMAAQVVPRSEGQQPLPFPQEQPGAQALWASGGQVMAARDLLAQLSAVRHVRLVLAYVAGGTGTPGVYWEVRGLGTPSRQGSD